MSLLLPLHAFAGHEGKSRGTMGGWKEVPKGGRGGGPLTCAFTNALLVPRKLKPCRLISFPTFVFSVCSLFLPAISLSNHRPSTVWVNKGLGSTLPPLQASVQLGKDCPPLWWDTVTKAPVSLFASQLIQKAVPGAVGVFSVRRRN